jgi:hypothetical protein
MKSIRSFPSVLTASGLGLVCLSSLLAGESLPALPTAQELPGALQFHGHYRHRSRGVDIAQPSELWVSRAPDGTVAALANVPFMGTTELASGDKENRLKAFRVRRADAGDKPGYGIDLECQDGKARLTRRGVRADCDGKELPVPAGACFDPNSRPDSYCAAQVLLQRFSSQKPGEAKELRACDWDNTGDGLADYSLKFEWVGKEKVQVPAGTFEANHLVQTQTSSGDTWFKKRAGHVTDFWVLENGVIVRILRHREPYEVMLLDCDVPGKLPGRQ